MASQKWIVLLALGALAVVASLWLVLAGGDPDGGAVAPGEAARPAIRPVPAASPVRPADEPAPAAAAAAPVAQEAREALEAASELSIVELDSARWIEGLLVLPAGAAWDESLRVLSVEAPKREEAQRPLFRMITGGADEPTRETRVLQRAKVAADGTFRVPCPEDAEWAYLDVEGEFAYLPEPFPVDLQGDVTTVELAPLLGARIRGRWIPPADAEGLEATLSGGTVFLTVVNESQLPPFMTGAFEDGPGVFHRTTVAVDGSFEIGGVDPDIDWRLVSHPSYLASAVTSDLGLEVGKATELDIHLARGARIEGRVVERRGSEGIPLAMVEVGFASEEDLLSLVTGESEDEEDEAEPVDPVAEELLVRRATSRGDGTFAVYGVPAGEVRVRAEKEGYRRSIRKRVDVLPGEVATDIELKLRRGEGLRGVVVWADGTPAANAVVQVGRDASGRAEPVDAAWRTRYAEVPCEADGSFQVLGLKRREQSVWGWASRRVGGRWVEGRAQLDGVEPSDDETLRLVLADQPLLTGRVSDPSGAPVTRFRTVVRDDEGNAGMMGAFMQSQGAIENDVEHPEGEFRLERLGEGEYAVSVQAEGYATSRPVGFRLPVEPDAAPLEIVLSGFSGLAGVVTDPTGAAVPGVEVRVTRADQNAADMMLAEVRAPESSRANGKGEFAFPQLGPGPIEVQAIADDAWVDSARVELELLPGESRTGVVVALRRGATLTGEVLDRNGEPLVDRTVEIRRLDRDNPFGNRDQTQVDTDASGWFELSGLEPGRVRATLEPSAEDWSRIRSDELDWWELQRTLPRAETELVDGQTTHVVLGREDVEELPKVAVTGTVIRRGAPVTGQVRFQRLPTREGASAEADIGAEGRFELELPGAGDYRVRATVRGDETHTFERHVPGGGADLVLAIPTGRIAGRVFDVEEEPAAGLPMSLRRVGPQRLSASDVGRFFNGNETDEDGYYEFDGLEPGTYVVTAGTALVSLFLGSAAGFGRALSDDIVIGPDEERDRVDIWLEAPCELTGFVRDPDGEAVNGATVFVYDERGRVVDSMSTVTTNAAGRFSYAGLAKGTYSAMARDEESASRTSSPVRIGPGDPGEVELEVDPGATLTVQLLDADGEPMRSSVSVVDSDGRRVSGLAGFTRFVGFASAGDDEGTENRVGPLSAGRYRVTARTGDGREVTGEVVVRDGQLTASVTLQLDG